MTEAVPLSEAVGQDLAEAVDLYRSFMEEIKTRLGAIKEAVDFLNANPEHPNGFLQAEFAYLQLRYVCELVALAALAAHKPYGLSETLWDSYNARRALLELATKNPQCFPRPVKITRSEAGIQLDVSDAGALTRPGLSRIYDRCGGALHRGRLRHIASGEAKVYDIRLMGRWAQRIGSLLAHHAFMILDEGLVLVTHLTAGPGGSVQVAISQAPGPAIYNPPKPAQ